MNDENGKLRARVNELEREVESLKQQLAIATYAATALLAQQRGEQPPPVPAFMYQPVVTAPGSKVES